LLKVLEERRKKDFFLWNFFQPVGWFTSWDRSCLDLKSRRYFRWLALTSRRLIRRARRSVVRPDLSSYRVPRSLLCRNWMHWSWMYRNWMNLGWIHRLMRQQSLPWITFSSYWDPSRLHRNRWHNCRLHQWHWSTQPRWNCRGECRLIRPHYFRQIGLSCWWWRNFFRPKWVSWRDRSGVDYVFPNKMMTLNFWADLSAFSVFSHLMFWKPFDWHPSYDPTGKDFCCFQVKKMRSRFFKKSNN